MNLDFLKNVTKTLAEPEKAVRSISTKTPEKGDIKITQGGQISYSEEFKKEIGEGGLDFINSKDWKLYKSEDHVVLTCIVPGDAKYKAKLDVKNVETPKPTNVEKFLIPMVRELYGIEGDFLTLELKVVKEVPFTNESGVYNIPKIKSGGDDDGQQMVVRRENVTFYPLIPVEAYEKLFVNTDESEVEAEVAAIVEEESEEKAIDFKLEGTDFSL